MIEKSQTLGGFPSSSIFPNPLVSPCHVDQSLREDYNVQTTSRPKYAFPLAKSTWPCTCTDFPHHQFPACIQAVAYEMLLLIWTTFLSRSTELSVQSLVTIWLCVSMQFHLCNRNTCNTCAQAWMTGGKRIPNLHPDLGIC